MAEDFGQKFGLDLETDTSAAKGLAVRRGVEKIRHLHTPLLCVLRRVTNRELRIWKVKGSDHEADIVAKPFSGDVLDRILTNLNFVFVTAVTEQALKAAANGSGLMESMHNFV